MKIRTVILASTLACSFAHAQTYSFDTETDFTDNFTQDGSNNYNFNATGGLDGGGGVLDSNTSQIAVENTSFNVATELDQGFSVSVFFQASSRAGNRPFSIGIVGDSSATYSTSTENTSHGFFGGLTRAGSSDNVVALRIHNDTDSATSAGTSTIAEFSSTNTTLTTGAWYNLDLTVGGISGNDFTGVVLTLRDSDDTGNIAGGNPILIADNGGAGYTITNATLAADTSAHFFFGGQGTHNWSAVDNFSISAVPEPSSYALIAGTLALGFIMVRRRR